MAHLIKLGLDLTTRFDNVEMTNNKKRGFNVIHLDLLLRLKDQFITKITINHRH